MVALEYLQKLHKAALDLAAQLKFDKSFEKDGVVVALYASLIEYTGSMCILINEQQKAGTSQIFRSFLEAYVDFKNLNEDPKYLNIIYAKYHQERVRALDDRIEGNPYLAQIAKHEEREEILRFHREKMEKLKEENYIPLNVRARFELANMLDEYSSIYHFESAQTHNNLSALLQRHFFHANEDYKIVIYHEYKLEDFDTHLDSMAGLLLDATDALHQRLGVQNNNGVEELKNELTLLRQA